MNEFENYLLDKKDSGVSASELRHMGKQAAVRYIQKDMPLNDSISELAKEAGLNLEQIKRVSEYANNDTFAAMFKLGFAKNITFPMADAAAISQTIHAPKEKTASIKREVIPSRMRYIPGQEAVDIEAVFGSGEGHEKLASYSDPSIKDATNNFLDAHRENKNASADMESLGDIFHIKLAALKDLCKEASRAGNSSGIIGYAVESGSPSKGLLDVISENVGDLVEYGHSNELEKMGMGMLMGNPITGLTQELEGVSQKLIMAQQAVSKTQMAMQELLSILRGPDTSGPAAQVFGGGMPIPGGPPADPMPMAGQPAGGSPSPSSGPTPAMGAGPAPQETVATPAPAPAQGPVGPAGPGAM